MALKTCYKFDGLRHEFLYIFVKAEEEKRYWHWNIGRTKVNLSGDELIWNRFFFMYLVEDSFSSFVFRGKSIKKCSFREIESLDRQGNG